MLTDFSWITVFDRVSSAHFFAFATLLIGVPSLAILASRELRNARRPRLRYAVVLANLFILWTLPLIVTILADLVWKDMALILPPLERAILALSIIIIGWAYLTVDHRRGRELSKIYPIILAFSLFVLWLVSTRYWYIEKQVVHSFNNSAYDTLWLLISCGVSVIGLIGCFIHFGRIYFAVGKTVFFTTLTLTFAIVLTFSLRGEMPQGDYATSYRVGWLIATLTLPINIARSSIHWRTLRSRPDITPGEMGPLTAEWSALQSLRISLAQEDVKGITQTILNAATLAVSSEFALLLRTPQWNADREMLYAEVIDVLDTNEMRSSPVIALSLSGLTQIAAALQQRKTLVLNPETDSRELSFLYRQLDMVGGGPAMLIPLHRSSSALLMASPLAEMQYQGSELEIMRQYAAMADDLLIQAAGVTQLVLNSTLPTRDEALLNAREHILELTAQLASIRSEPLKESETITPASDVTENAPLVWRALLEEKQRENARLRVERDTLSERLDEWEEPLRVLGIEGGALGLWHFLADEKDRLAHAKAEIEHLQRERDDMRKKGMDRWQHYNVPRQLSSISSVPNLQQKKQRKSLLDVLPILEQSVASVASRLRDKDIQVELAILPSLPRVTGEGVLLRAALASIVEQVVTTAPREGKLKITATPVENHLHLELSVSGARMVSAETLRSARTKLEAFGGNLHHHTNEAGDESAVEEKYVLVLPTDLAKKQEPAASRRVESWRSAF